MMEPSESAHGGVCSSPETPPPTSALPPPSEPISSRQERSMVFFRRPDLAGQRSLFQGDRSCETSARKTTRDRNVPVQLVGIEGDSHLGVPLGGTLRGSAHPSETAVSSGVARANNDAQARSRRPPRLLVTSDILRDDATATRLRAMKWIFLAAASASVCWTALMLYPSDSSAWFYVDPLTSSHEEKQMRRVLETRAQLLALSLVCNGIGVLAAVSSSGAFLSFYIFGTVVSGVWTLSSLLPHPFFLFRLLCDVLLVALASVVRSHKMQPWFVSNFHQLRY